MTAPDLYPLEMLLVNTSEIGEHDRLIAEVLEPLTAKVIKPIVRRQLRVSLRSEDTSFENQNALELVGDIQASLLAALLSRSGQNGNALSNIDAYATTVTRNACCQHLREKFPVRTNQESALRYFLSHTNGYAIWQDAAKRWLCGYAQWRDDARISPVPIDMAAADVPVVGGNSREKYTVILQAVFECSGAPVRLEELVSHVMSVLGVGERVEVAAEDDPVYLLRSPEASIQNHLETVSRLRLIWDSVRAMPVTHRKALLLSLKDSGGGLLAVLPLSGVADISEIAEALELSAEDLEAIWETLPWGDLQIAEHLGVTRQQVINMRQSARARLIRLTPKP